VPESSHRVLGSHDVNLPRGVTIRPARMPDAPAMAELSRDLIEVGLEWRYTARRVAGLIGDPEAVALVADAGAPVQGFAVMHFGDEHAHLILLCVRAAHQKRGIGRGLLEWLLASARVAGMASVHLELRADNAAGLAFYRRLGFEERLLVPAYYGGQIAARRMVLRLRREASAA
jgi:[ribosomal protein S18]-alanine N-acetyltransferase